MADAEYMTIAEAAIALGLSRNGVYYQRKVGRLTLYRRLGRTVVRRGDVERLKQAQPTSARPKPEDTPSTQEPS